MSYNCEFIPLTELLEFIVDNRGKTVPASETGIPLIATNCIKNTELYPVFEKVRYVSQEIYDTWFRAHPKPGDIIFVNKGTPGRVCLVPNPVNFCIAQDMMAFRVNTNKVYNKYLFAVLRSREFQDKIGNYHVGTMIPHFKKGDLEKLLIPIPSKEIQKKIGDMYYLFSNKVQLNNEMNKTLEEMAQAIFKQWFVDFEFPNEEGKPYKSSGGEMVESKLGMIPKGWEVKDIDEVCNVTIGKTPPRKQQQWFSENTEDIKWISIKDLGNCGTYIFNTSEYLTNEAVEKFNVKRVPKDTVILSFKLTVGRIAITTSEMLTNEAIAHFDIIDKKQVTTEYLYSYLKKFNYETLGSTSSIATAVNSKIIKKIPILVSDPNVLKEFSNYIENLFKLIRNNELEIIKLKNTRDILLPKLMSGEIRVNIN